MVRTTGCLALLFALLGAAGCRDYSFDAGDPLDDASDGSIEASTDASADADDSADVDDAADVEGDAADAGEDTTDTFAADDGPDGAIDVPDVTIDAPLDAAACSDAGPATEPCGKCGTRTRDCIAPGVWGPWSACSGEGVCSPGTIEPVTGTCPGALEKKTKTCTSSCTWGAETCALPKGWTPIALPPSGFEGRIQHSAVWTGGELFVYGGGKKFDGEIGKKDGAVYSLFKNSWEFLPAMSTVTHGRKRHSAVWVPSRFEMIVWGGHDDPKILGDGAIYDAYAKTWKAMPAAPIAPRELHGAVWVPTTGQMIVWGGGDASTDFADGAAYQPDLDTWTKLPPVSIAARSSPVMHWTGTEVLIWGGEGASGPLKDGALYDPVKKSWRLIPAASVAGRAFPARGMLGSSFALFGGGVATLAWDGALLSLGPTLSWSTISAPPSSVLPTPRTFSAFWSAGTKLTIWSGARDDGTGKITYDFDGATYDSATATWTALTSSGAPTPRAFATSLWTGSAALVWSGQGNPGGGIPEILRDGAIYVP